MPLLFCSTILQMAGWIFPDIKYQNFYYNLLKYSSTDVHVFFTHIALAHLRLDQSRTKTSMALSSICLVISQQMARKEQMISQIK